jgi:hypothetical protein
MFAGWTATLMPDVQQLLAFPEIFRLVDDDRAGPEHSAPDEGSFPQPKAVGGITEPIEITLFTKRAGTLSKTVTLLPDGTIVSDSVGRMSRGTACRQSIRDLRHLSEGIAQLRSNQAIALGRLRADLPERVEVKTIGELAKLDGPRPPNLIARSKEFIDYRDGARAIVLLDYDAKGMSEAVRTKIEAAGSVWTALVSVFPELAGCAHLYRKSTSADLHRADTGEAIGGGKGGAHYYVTIQDSSDAVRFLQTLHERLWLAGFGWYMVSTSGALLERSLIDRSVGSPERLIFEAPPTLVGLRQGNRPPAYYEAAGGGDGEPLDTRRYCMPLAGYEPSDLDAIRAELAADLKPECERRRAAWHAERVEQLVQAGVEREKAEAAVAEWCEGRLGPEVR